MLYRHVDATTAGRYAVVCFWGGVKGPGRGGAGRGSWDLNWETVMMHKRKELAGLLTFDICFPPLYPGRVREAAPREGGFFDTTTAPPPPICPFLRGPGCCPFSLLFTMCIHLSLVFPSLLSYPAFLPPTQSKPIQPRIQPAPSRPIHPFPVPGEVPISGVSRPTPTLFSGVGQGGRGVC